MVGVGGVQGGGLLVQPSCRPVQVRRARVHDGQRVRRPPRERVLALGRLRLSKRAAAFLAGESLGAGDARLVRGSAAHARELTPS